LPSPTPGRAGGAPRAAITAEADVPRAVVDGANSPTDATQKAPRTTEEGEKSGPAEKQEDKPRTGGNGTKPDEKDVESKSDEKDDESKSDEKDDESKPDEMGDESKPDEMGDESEADEEGAEEAEPDEEEEEDKTRLLMKALGIEDSPVKFYGWIQNSFTGNTNGRPPSGENFGVFTNHRANQWMGNQYYLVVENPLEQDETVNFGFQVDTLFGHDWAYTKMTGLFDEAFDRPLNNFAGVDLPQFYGQVHLPDPTGKTKGFDVIGGRWYSPAGYEGGPAVQRPLLSVPYLYNFGQPFTHFGALGTWHLTDKVDLFSGPINGWDRWINRNYRWGYIGGFSWTFNRDKTNLKAWTIQGPNQFPYNLRADTTIIPYGVGAGNIGPGRNPLYPRSNRSLLVYVLEHKWSDKLTQVVEFDHGFENDIPGLDRNAPLDAEWYGGFNTFLYQFSDKLTGVWRSEVWRDDDGIRTGSPTDRTDPTPFADTFYEMTLGAIYKPVPSIWIRPEARYDWAQFKTPYNDGTRGSQLTLAFDIILLY
jgi:hypothetical protein